MSVVAQVENPKPIVSLIFGVSVTFWAKELADFFTKGVGITPDLHKFSSNELLSWIILFSGGVFLVDLLCIVWWYARYIYRIQATATFSNYFLDFVVGGMFNLAANCWTNPKTFLFASGLGTAVLLFRFYRLYLGPNLTLNDKQILRSGLYFLATAMIVAVVSFLLLSKYLSLGSKVSAFLQSKAGIDKVLLHTIPAILASIGIFVTWKLYRKIEVAVDVYLAQDTVSVLTDLHWPENGMPNDHQRTVIREQTANGLARFEALFTQVGKCEHVHSRVHGEADLRIQNYILSVSSCKETEHHPEIASKSFMVAVSHWLDDLADGRGELDIYNQIKNSNLSLNPDESETLFKQIYRPLIIHYTDRSFYDKLVAEIREACLFEYNRPYMFLGLNRVAYGAVMFSPKIEAKIRLEIMRSHNLFLKEWNNERTPFGKQVENLLDEILKDKEVGTILLALTTKTVQEVSMSSEKLQLDPQLSILFSILYAPLVYYHDIQAEINHHEMVSLQSFDIDYDVWIPWVKKARSLIEVYPEISRKTVRLQQIKMAYMCFERGLPDSLRKELSPIYLSPGGVAKAVTTFLGV